MMSAAAPVRVVVVGYGSLGAAVVRAAATDPRVEVVGVLEIDEALIGTRVGGTADIAGVPVVGSLADLPARDGLPALPDVAVHATESRPERIVDHLVSFLDAGIDVITAAEGLFDPWLRHPVEAARLDAAARRSGATFTGTGINPGFILDQLALDLAAATTDVRSIRMTRTVATTETGPGDVEHVGFGLSVPEFERRIAEGSVEGHIGTPESFVQIAERLGLEIDRVEETWEPILRDTAVHTKIGEIPAGHVAGIVQTATALRGDIPVLTARMRFVYGDSDEQQSDTIEIDGQHPMSLTIAPAVVSVVGAAQVIVNAIPLVHDAAPGIVSSLDLPTRSRRSPLRYEADLDAARPGLVPLVLSGGAV
jgi:2,4-diaminopentanoate dehydrogenase